MLQNITLLNSVRNNVGLALDVALVAEHRTNLLCVESSQEAVQTVSTRSGSVRSGSGRGDSGKRPCDETRAADRARATLRADAVDARDGRFGADAAQAVFAERASGERASSGIEGEVGGTPAAAATRAYSLRKPQQASMRAKLPASKMPAAIWASLVLSRV